MRFLTLLLTLSFYFSSWAATPGSKKWVAEFEKDKGKVEFNAIGRPSALKIRGKGEGPQGSLTVDANSVTGNLEFDLDTLDTGIKLRNDHMKKKYLETEKHPRAALKITKMILPSAFEQKEAAAEQIPFEGLLKVHGVEKPVTGTAKLKKNESSVEGEAFFDTRVRDFEIASPSFAGVTMADEVKVSVEFSANIK